MKEKNQPSLFTEILFSNHFFLLKKTANSEPLFYLKSYSRVFTHFLKFTNARKRKSLIKSIEKMSSLSLKIS
nr:MAG TPA: hypothetical protein [Caudoviricetes sp.]